MYATTSFTRLLGASVARLTTRHQTDRNRGRKSQSFAKLKEVFCQRTCLPKTAHLILPNRTQALPPPFTWLDWDNSNTKDNSIEIAAYQRKVNIFALNAD